MRKRPVRYFQALATLAATLLLPAATTLAAEPYQPVTDSAHGFAVRVPAIQWERVGADDPRFAAVGAVVGRPDAIALALAHKDPDAQASIVVTIESGRINLPLTESGLQESVRGISFPAGLAGVEAAEFAKIDGYNAVRLLLTMNLAGAPQGQRQWQYVLPAGTNAFHLMFSARADRFAEMEPTFKEVIESFRWTTGPYIKLGSGTVFDNVIRMTLIGAVIGPLIGLVISLANRLRGRSRANGKIVHSEAEAEALLVKAIKFEAKHRYEDSLRLYRHILSDFPGAEAAKDAKVRYDNLSKDIETSLRQVAVTDEPPPDDKAETVPEDIGAAENGVSPTRPGFWERVEGCVQRKQQLHMIRPGGLSDMERPLVLKYLEKTQQLLTPFVKEEPIEVRELLLGIPTGKPFIAYVNRELLYGALIKAFDPGLIAQIATLNADQIGPSDSTMLEKLLPKQTRPNSYLEVHSYLEVPLPFSALQKLISTAKDVALYMGRPTTREEEVTVAIYDTVLRTGGAAGVMKLTELGCPEDDARRIISNLTASQRESARVVRQIWQSNWARIIALAVLVALFRSC